MATKNRIQPSSIYMITKNKIIEVSPTLFLNSLPTEMHSEVSALFYDLKVDYIVLMIPKDGGKRQVIPVGRKSQYKEITEISSDLIDGMQAKACVDARKAFPDLSKKHSPSKRPSSTQTTKLQKAGDPQVKTSSIQSDLLQKQVDELKHKLAEERSKVMLRDQTIDELKRNLAQDSDAKEANIIADRNLLFGGDSRRGEGSAARCARTNPLKMPAKSATNSSAWGSGNRSL
jgi:hypothetical protein